jgi:morphogenetic protein associated with SpoVID
MKIHIVRPGDEFEQLVQKYNVPLERLLAANPGLHEGEALEVGTKIRIPTGKVRLTKPKQEEAAVEEINPIYLKPVQSDEQPNELAKETEVDEWEVIEAEFAKEGIDDEEFAPYFMTSSYQPFPILPYPPYATGSYERQIKAKKESSSTFYG